MHFSHKRMHNIFLTGDGQAADDCVTHGCVKHGGGNRKNAHRTGRRTQVCAEKVLKSKG